MLSRASAPTPLTAAIYHPLLCVIATGRKRLVLGGNELVYDSESYLVSSAHMPVSGHVIEAPCLSIVLRLEPSLLTGILLDMPPDREPEEVPQTAMAVTALDADLIEPLVRLLRLLDRPSDIPIIAPLAERELLYRLLNGPRGRTLRQMARPASQLSQIRRAIDVMRRRFQEKLRIEALASVAGMSLTSFHRHFRAVTSMSPLQYQKRLRLHEARRLLLGSDINTGHVAADVGYESASQFSREYRRMFGATPSHDAARARQALGEHRIPL
ncbi:MAG: AraC family transcriptional regulator [Clostridia bacterium]|nr:AraC family transcriptional regulator [Deltaproteobacteria bacterium]